MNIANTVVNSVPICEGIRSATRLSLVSSARELSPERLADALRFQKKWKEFQEQNPDKSQDDVASEVGWTQSNFNHYLKARTPLNIEGVLRVCAVTNWKVHDISPGFADMMIRAGYVPAEFNTIDPEVIKLAAAIDKQPPKQRAKSVEHMRIAALDGEAALEKIYPGVGLPPRQFELPTGDDDD